MSYIYHVTTQARVASILATGLEARSEKLVTQKITTAPRVYLGTNYEFTIFEACHFCDLYEQGHKDCAAFDYGTENDWRIVWIDTKGLKLKPLTDRPLPSQEELNKCQDLCHGTDGEFDTFTWYSEDNIPASNIVLITKEQYKEDWLIYANLNYTVEENVIKEIIDASFLDNMSTPQQSTNN